MGLFSQARNLSSQARDLYVELALESFYGVTAKPLGEQVSAFAKILKKPSVSLAIRANPFYALGKVFTALTSLPDDKRLEAFQIILQHSIIPRVIKQTPHSVKNIFQAIQILPRNTQLSGFEKVLAHEAVYTNNMFPSIALEAIPTLPSNVQFSGFQKALTHRYIYTNDYFLRWSAPKYIFGAIGKMPPQDRERAGHWAFFNPGIQKLLLGPDKYSRFEDFLGTMIEHVPTEPFLSMALENSVVQDAIKRNPRSIINAVQKAPEPVIPLKVLLNSSLVKDGIIFDIHHADDLISTADAIIPSFRADDKTRIALAKLLIDFTQTKVAQEQAGPAAYLTPMLNTEGQLVVIFGRALGQSRGGNQPPKSFSEISKQFDEASSGWTLRPVNTANDQIKYSHLLPGNDNLYTRAVKPTINNQAIHAVMGNKTGKVNISVEPE